MKALLTRGLTSLGLLRNLQRTFALTFSNSRSDHVSIMKTWEDDSSKIHFGGGGEAVHRVKWKLLEMYGSICGLG